MSTDVENNRREALSEHATDAFICLPRTARAVFGQHHVTRNPKTQRRRYVRWECRNVTTGRIVAFGMWCGYFGPETIGRSRAQKGADAINADRRVLGRKIWARPLTVGGY